MSRKASGGGEWKEAGRTAKTAFDLGGLEQGKDYAFKVVASNAVGESEALETPRNITAKDQFSECRAIRLMYYTDVQYSV